MNIGKITAGFAAIAASALLQAAVPEVSDVTMTQADTRLVTITYTLADAPAVITLDVQTNCTDGAETKWASIGGAAVCNAEGDVWRKVGGDLAEGASVTGTVTWRPDLSWPDRKIASGGARAVITAWALDNTPDYMVVDISAAATPGSQKYYPSVDCLPGGILSNQAYRTTKLVMRKIMAKGVEWTMGSTALETTRLADREATHQVTLTNNYYMGVFLLTQAQWALVQTSNTSPSYFKNVEYRAMRPVELVSYNEIRNSANTQTADSAYNWPADPNPLSFLGLLRTKTGIDFDLPSEAQWEFAARAGNGDTKWGDGSGIKNSNVDSNMDMLGRHIGNGGYVDGKTKPSEYCMAENGTAIVGSYAPNDWGLYDTAGNVWEWCLDWYEDDITEYNGQLNIDHTDGAKNLSGAAGGNRSFRGGSWYYGAMNCRPAYRGSANPYNRFDGGGFRVLCTAGLR